jgi:drug/metabolite transporter (DMT)-like permease
MIGEVFSFSHALLNAFTNTLGGKATQLSSWRNTLRASTTIAMVVISIAILFNLETLTLRAVAIGISGGLIGGLGLPLIYQAFAVGSVSFVSPVVALVQSFNLILFAVIVENEKLSWAFPIAALFGVAGLFACSRTSATQGSASFKVFGLAALAGCCFTVFTFFLVFIEQDQILAVLFGGRIGVLSVSFFFPPKKKSKKVAKEVKESSKDWRKFALLSGLCEGFGNLAFVLAITNLDLSKVGIFMTLAPALASLIGIKLLKQKPSLINWLGIAASTTALAIIAVI